MEIIGIVVSTELKGRIQLGRDAENCMYVVRHLHSDTGVFSSEKKFSFKEPGTENSSFGAALEEFTKRIKTERDTLVSYEPIEEFALILNPSKINEIGDYHAYIGEGRDIAASVAEAEEDASVSGPFDIEALRRDPTYTSALSALIQSSSGMEHTGIALLIR